MSDLATDLQLWDDTPLRSREPAGRQCKPEPRNLYSTEANASGRSRATDPETSKQAAACVSSALESWIERIFAAEGPLSDDELCGHLPDLHAPTLKTARSRLSKRGILAATDERRPSLRGRSQIVWRLA